MKEPSLPQGERGYELLLEHCTALTRLRSAQPPAYVRLEQVLGNELARLLVAALATRPGGRVSFAF